MTFQEKYREELSDVRFSEQFEEKTVQLLTQMGERQDRVILMKRRKRIRAAVLAAAIVMALSLSAFAVVSLLSPADVADRFGHRELAVLFEKSDFEPETVTGERYCVTFLGTAQGENLCETDGVPVREGRTYAAFAVYRKDGTPLDILDGSPIRIIPVADGQEIHALMRFGMSASCFVKDGVLYALYDYTDLEVSSGEKISLMAFETDFPLFQVFTANDRGEIVFADGYTGFQGKFALK